jgi:hypothetical protein
MTTLRAEEMQMREAVLETWPVHITSYKLGAEYKCVIDNVSPGAAIARASGPTREAAEEAAISMAVPRLASTRRVKQKLEGAQAAASAATQMLKK